MTKYAIQNKNTKYDTLIFPVFEDDLLKQDKILDKDIYNQVAKVLKTKDFEAKKNQISLIYSENENCPRILLIGLGKKDKFDTRVWKQVVGTAIIVLQNKKLQKLGLHVTEEIIEKFGAYKLAKETVIAAETANYAFDDYKDKETKVKPVENLDLVLSDIKKYHKDLEKGIKDGQTIAEGVSLTRHLGNVPPTIMTPSYLANEARKIGNQNKNVKVKILSRPEIQKMGMGCLLAVSSGSQHEPKFIILEYNSGSSKEKPIVLVGKGITFDSGGISLKPGDALSDMKFDMLGAATVLGVIKSAAKLNLKKNIIGLIPACENMPSGTAYRPDDILTAMNGKTVEVANTDAEGRLILADALCYAKKYNPKEVIDFATLTGACLVALGNERSGLFTNEENIYQDLKKSSEEVGEQLWRLPLGEEYSEAMKSEVADIKNIGGVGHPRFGGASTGAAFLQFFTDYPWAHIDLSCSYYGGKGKSYIRGGANGWGVETMIEYLCKA